MAAELKPERAASTIRMMRESDAASVEEILRDAPEAVFWPEASVKEVLTWEGALALVADLNGKVTGFLIGRQAGDEAEILNLAVVPQERKKGQGGALLHAAVEKLRTRGVKRVFLEVRESNAAGISFYRKHGFSEAGRRAGYYRDPEETAIVMEKSFTA
ncbi:MAG TPA: ribosomal protein S18-alanine N-acetyltransferase [Candidatus Acidoferrum sp.]|nr:ribosomal protein S18-alanine N-acetyltransferase [Candidatus Acidoferrum sp.]